MTTSEQHMLTVVEAQLRELHPKHANNSCQFRNKSTNLASVVQFSLDGCLQCITRIEPSKEATVFTNLDGFAAVVMVADVKAIGRVPAHGAFTQDQRIYPREQLEYVIMHDWSYSVKAWRWDTLTPDDTTPTTEAAACNARTTTQQPPCIEALQWRWFPWHLLSRGPRDEECTITNALQKDSIVICQYADGKDSDPVHHIIRPRSHENITIRGTQRQIKNLADGPIDFAMIKRFNADEDNTLNQSNHPLYIPKDCQINLQSKTEYIVHDSTFIPHKTKDRKYFWGVPWGLPLIRTPPRSLQQVPYE